MYFSFNRRFTSLESKDINPLGVYWQSDGPLQRSIDTTTSPPIFSFYFLSTTIHTVVTTLLPREESQGLLSEKDVIEWKSKNSMTRLLPRMGR